MSRPRSTGRFDTVEELEQYIIDQYALPRETYSSIARRARVSPTLVKNILNNYQAQETQKILDSRRGINYTPQID